MATESRKDLKDLFRRIWDGVWHRSADSSNMIAESYADDFRLHISSLPEPLNRSGFAQLVAGWLKAFPDGRMEINDITAQGDKVWCYWTSTGTHSDTYLGVPRTGRPVRYQGLDIWRFRPDGKVAETWAVPDVLSLLRQLGTIR